MMRRFVQKGMIMPVASSNSGGGDSCGIETVVDNSYLLEETTFELEEDEEIGGLFYGGLEFPKDKFIPIDKYRPDDVFIVTFNGTEYKCPYMFKDNSAISFGSSLYDELTDAKYPFEIGYQVPFNGNAASIYVNAFVKDVTISVKADVARIKETFIPSPYLFDLDEVGIVKCNKANTIEYDPNICMDAVNALNRDRRITVKFKKLNRPVLDNWDDENEYHGVFGLTNTFSKTSTIEHQHVNIDMYPCGDPNNGCPLLIGFLPDGCVCYMEIDPFEGKITTIARALVLSTEGYVSIN